MYRFLASRRWLVRTLAGVLLVVLFVRLGLWQLDRNEQRSHRNAVIEANATADAVSVDDLAPVGSALPASDEWRPVELRGRYDVDHQLVVQLRPLDGQAGVHVLTPLVTTDGPALLVDRGFLPASGPATAGAHLPAPPSGQVEVVARLRVSEEGRGTGGDPSTGGIRHVDVDQLAGFVPDPLYGAWAELISQEPPATEALQLIPAPEADAGPHLSYAIQWFLFACVGIGGYVVLVRAEARGRRQLDQHDAATPTG